MKIEKDDIIFDSGRRVKSACNLGIIGLSPDLDWIYEGYDGNLCPVETTQTDIDFGYDITDNEKIEIADYMISLWQRLKEKLREH